MREFEYRRTSARTPSLHPSAASCRRWRAWVTAESCGFTTRRALGARLRLRVPLLAHLEALLQASHEIHDLRALRFFRLRHLDLLSFHLRANDLHQVGAIIVGVLRRIERLRQIAHELLGHLQLLWPYAVVRRKREVGHVHQL